MIREKTILCNLNLLKLSDEQLINSFVTKDRNCPSCGANHSCSNHGSYERCMITIANQVRKEVVVSISRVICSSCGKTHALLPDFLIPFASYSLRFVLHVLRAYLCRTGTVAQLCESFAISISTLYKWIHLFKEHANLLLSALEQIQWINGKTIRFIERKVALPRLFFKRYRFSFLQNHKRHSFAPSVSQGDSFS